MNGTYFFGRFQENSKLAQEKGKNMEGDRGEYTVSPIE